MIGDKFKQTLSVPIRTIPWDKGNSYFKRLFRWLLYTRKWEFSEDWYFKLNNKIWIKIPKGFIFDGASIPKLFRFLLSPTGILFIPGIIHDYGYRYNKLIGVKAIPVDDEFLVIEEFSYHPGAGKMFWDRMFRHISYQITGLLLVPNVVYSAVVLGGAFAWWKRRRQNKKETLL